MAVKEYVFASRAERENYEKLARQWGQSYVIQSNLPYLNVFSIDDVDLPEDDIERLKKTSVDYTLCDREYRPIACIEFDGLYDGVNIGPAYFPSRTPRGKWRDKIMSLKLKVARESTFPFFIVGNAQFDDLSSELRLTIVDGIIGDVLAEREVHERASAGFDPRKMGRSVEDFERLPESVQWEIEQEWLTNVEAAAELNHNPIRRAAAELEYSLGVNRWRCNWTQFPEFTADAGIEERIKEFSAALYVGSTVTIHADDFGELTETVMLPKFDTAEFGVGLSLSFAIAKLLCLTRLARLRAQSGRVE